MTDGPSIADWPLGARDVLVVAPHPDDESLGAGGLIALLAARGARLTVVFVTDGGASHRQSRRWPRPRLAALRQAEARSALIRLGAGDARIGFLGLADAAMPAPGSMAYETAAAAFAALLDGRSLDLAVLPWRRDPHCDHRDSHALAVAVLARTGQVPRCLEYAIWLDEFGAPGDRPRPGEVVRRTLEITPVQARKRAAVLAHHSQTSRLIDDDPDGFLLEPQVLERLTGPQEQFWESPA